MRAINAFRVCAGDKHVPRLRRGVGPPDAEKTGGPVPLIEIAGRKCGFTGQPERRG